LIAKAIVIINKLPDRKSLKYSGGITGYFPVLMDGKKAGAGIYVSVFYTNFFSTVVPIELYSFIGIFIRPAIFWRF
jgi:hypothetical protein